MTRKQLAGPAIAVFAVFFLTMVTGNPTLMQLGSLVATVGIFAIVFMLKQGRSQQPPMDEGSFMSSFGPNPQVMALSNFLAEEAPAGETSMELILRREGSSLKVEFKGSQGPLTPSPALQQRIAALQGVGDTTISMKNNGDGWNVSVRMP